MYDVSCSFFLCVCGVFIRLRKFPSILSLLWIFIMNGYCILSNAFSTSVDMIMFFFFFSLLMWWVTVIDFQMLNQSCISGINPTWLWGIIFLYIVAFNVLIFCCRFLHLCSWQKLVCSFLVRCLSGFGNALFGLG